MLTDKAKKDEQLVTTEWKKIQSVIEGVKCKEVLHVPRDHGVLTEIYRPEWDPTGFPVVHCYQSRLFPGAIGAWSCHARQHDRLFASLGHLKLVLYDARENSSTFGTLNEFHVGEARPALLTLPPGIWHGVQNLGATDVLLLNFPSEAYRYDDPDHYRLPYDTAEIPYSWGNQTRRETRLRADAKNG